MRYVGDYGQNVFSELALADSSRVALMEAIDVVPAHTNRFQIDLMDLRWNKRWESIFLLDVIEHLPDDVGAMVQARDALMPDGLVFVTVPALDVFWSYNDELAHHQRRVVRRVLHPARRSLSQHGGSRSGWTEFHPPGVTNGTELTQNCSGASFCVYAESEPAGDFPW